MERPERRWERDIIKKKKKRDNRGTGIGRGLRGERCMKEKREKGTQQDSPDRFSAGLVEPLDREVLKLLNGGSALCPYVRQPATAH